MASGKTSVWLMAGGALLLVAGVVTAVWLGTKKAAGETVKGNPLDIFFPSGSSAEPSTGSGIFKPSTPTLDGNKLLKKGVTGAEVKELQRMLNTLHKQPPPHLVVDGIFGPLTESRLKMFNNGLGQTTLASMRLMYGGVA